MNVIKQNEDYVILKLHWFEKYYGHILYFLFYFLPEVIFLFALGYYLKNPLFYILLICSLLLFQLLLLFSYKYFIEINFEKEQVFTYVKILGIKIDLINYSIYDIISLVSVIKISKLGIICRIEIKTKKGYVKKPLLELQSFSRRSRKFYEYYIDFFNILIVKALKEKGYNIRSNLLNFQTSLIDVNFNNLKKLSKEHSNSKQFPLDLVVCFIIFPIAIYIFFIILIIIKYLSDLISLI
ncbi:MAG: hypothetical protein EU529_01685 [Promethearchaeota archaeon]|nr:MAG: hypothetical protein EU529_01685 [Candidatus Lokiarchaeota archaeon]